MKGTQTRGNVPEGGKSVCEGPETEEANPWKSVQLVYDQLRNDLSSTSPPDPVSPQVSPLNLQVSSSPLE